MGPRATRGSLTRLSSSKFAPKNPHRLYPTLWHRIRANCDCSGECWLWRGSVGTNHRPQITLRIDGKHRTLNVARLVLLQFYRPGPWEASHQCVDDTWLCVRPDHLLPETKKQNMARRWKRPVPPAIDWPRVVGPTPVWDDPDAFERGVLAEACPF